MWAPCGGTTQPGYAGTNTNLQIVLNTPQNPSLNQVTKKEILAEMFLLQKILKSKISNPKKSFDHPCRLKPGVPTPSSGPYVYVFIAGSQYSHFTFNIFFVLSVC